MGQAGDMKHEKLFAAGLWTAIVALMTFMSIPESLVLGDGKEYLAYVMAFVDHGTPRLTPDDLLGMEALLKARQPSFPVEMALFGKETSLGGLGFGQGFVSSPAGELFSLHFWLYPMLVAPFFALFQGLGWAPMGAFTLFNGVMLMLVVQYLMLCWKRPTWQKHAMASVFLSVGAPFYIWWAHPEVFTACLLMLALLMASDGRHGPAMLVASLASTHNPPVFIVTLLIAGWAMVSAQRTGLLRPAVFLRESIKWLPWGGVSSLIAALPAAYFLFFLGVSNPIVASGSADFSLISLGRLFSMFFDLNMGLIVGAPGLVLVFLVLFSVVALRTANWRWQGQAWVLSLAAFSAVLMALPALATTNWNHGQTVYSRYAYWIGVPLAAGLIHVLGYLSARTRRGVIGFVLLLQCMTMLIYGFWGKSWRGDYTTHKPHAAFAMRVAPGLYNPVPEIFFERVLGHEVAPNRAVAFPQEGAAMKLLVPADQALDWQARCAGSAIVGSEGGWAYVNMNRSAPCDAASATRSR